MKIVADTSIPFLKGLFEPYAETVYLDGSSIGPDDVRDADAIIVRSRTRCGRELLEGSRVKLISSATIDINHIDTEWCDAHGVAYSNAPGSNASGVAQYVFSALYGTASRSAINLEKATLGVIGVGNVGRRVAATGRTLGFRVLMCDPPRASREGGYEFTALDELLKESDIVTLHVPLCDSTRRMADGDFFRKMKEGAFFINTSRGEIEDDEALKKAIGRLGPVIIDTWNNEPDVDRELLDMVDIATPHIAGYTYQGKQNSTAVAVRSVARFFGIKGLYTFFPKTGHPSNESVKLDVAGKNQGEIASLMQYNYPIFTDDFMFRLQPDGFVELRKQYNYRREFYIE